MILTRRQDEDDSQYAARMFNTFMRNRTALSEDRARESRNWRMYSGVNDGQWDRQALQLLRSESRPAHTINIVQGAVELAYGILKQNPHETQYTPMEPAVEGTVNLAQWLYDFEKDRGNWDREEMMFLISGLVFKGVAQYYPDFRHNPLGNVGWRALVPWEVEPDARWVSDAISECRFVFKARKVPIDEIINTYQTKTLLIKEALRAAQEGQGPFNTERLSERGVDFADYVDGDHYLVIETYFQEVEVETYILDLETRTEKRGQPEHIVDMAVKDQPQRFKKMVDRKSVTKVVTICPGLDPRMILASGSYAFQLGMLPFQFWSAKNLWGERQGEIDKLIDLQQLLNKRESALTHWESMNSNGSVLADSTVFQDDREKTRFERDFNKPGQVFWADGGMRGINQAVVPVTAGQPPMHLADGAQRTMAYLDKISGMNSPVNPNGSGNPMGANSKHYTEILAASFVRWEFLHQGLQSVWAERAEGFIPAAQYIYTGATRRLKNPTSPNALVVNQQVMRPDGEWATVNNIGELSRYDYTIAMAKDGMNKKQSDLSDIRMQLPLISNPVLSTLYQGKLAEYSPFDEEFKKQAEKATKIHFDFQVLQMESQIAQMKQSMQAQPQPGQSPMGAKDAATSPGMGEIPGEAGISGSGTAANNVQSAHPSDLGAR